MKTVKVNGSTRGAGTLSLLDFNNIDPAETGTHGGDDTRALNYEYEPAPNFLFLVKKPFFFLIPLSKVAMAPESLVQGF